MFEGSGFRPFDYVELQVSAFATLYGNDMADAGGDVRIRSLPVDLGQCSLSPLVLDVVRGDPEPGGDRYLGTVTVRLCS